jgi:urease accessory protein UreF
MTVGINRAPTSPAELLGDPHPLIEQLGLSEDLTMAGSVTLVPDLQGVNSVPALRSFLDGYRTHILVPVELPAIARAFQHAARGEVRELIELDRGLAAQKVIERFAVASYRVGQRQMAKLRPMRDQRVVQRYLAAIEAGEARGWHTLVYGVSLAMFSLPLRQGVQHYIEQTLNGFVESSARSLRLAESDCESILGEQMVHVPGLVAAALPPLLA